jgi:hypothetical protein
MNVERHYTGEQIFHKYVYAISHTSLFFMPISCRYKSITPKLTALHRFRSYISLYFFKYSKDPKTG